MTLQNWYLGVFFGGGIKNPRWLHKVMKVVVNVMGGRWLMPNRVVGVVLSQEVTFELRTV